MGVVRKHITKLSLEAIDMNREYKSNGMYAIKPSGLWYSLGDEWRKWCEGNMPEWMSNKDNEFELEIDLNNMLILEKPEDVLAFNKKYNKKMFDHLSPTYVDWDMVMKDYAGMEIRNYYDLKYDMFYNADSFVDYTWLSAWDVPSGCVWDLSIVKIK